MGEIARTAKTGSAAGRLGSTPATARLRRFRFGGCALDADGPGHRLGCGLGGCGSRLGTGLGRSGLGQELRRRDRRMAFTAPDPGAVDEVVTSVIRHHHSFVFDISVFFSGFRFIHNSSIIDDSGRGGRSRSSGRSRSRRRGRGRNGDRDRNDLGVPPVCRPLWS